MKIKKMCCRCKLDMGAIEVTGNHKPNEVTHDFCPKCLRVEQLRVTYWILIHTPKYWGTDDRRAQRICSKIAVRILPIVKEI